MAAEHRVADEVAGLKLEGKLETVVTIHELDAVGFPVAFATNSMLPRRLCVGCLTD